MLQIINSSGGIKPKKDSEIKKIDINITDEYFSKEFFISNSKSMKKKSIQNINKIKRKKRIRPFITVLNKKE